VKRTAFVMHPDCGTHDTGWRHPEHQGRLPALVHAIYRETPALLDVVRQEEAEPARSEDLLRVHTAAHVDWIREMCEASSSSGELLRLDADTVVSPASWAAALAAAGCAVSAARLVLGGEVGSAFAGSRPPGHHATSDRAMGFCLFNNVAVAARWAQAEVGVGRVLIVDWDVHHGNGTQDIFYEDPSVYYLSLHLGGHYPGTGAASERGAGAGVGTTRNVVLPHGTDAARYRRAFEDALDATLAEFTPELVMISAGFDCLAGDPLGGIRLEPADLHALTGLIADAAGTPVAAALEGGYVPKRIGTGAIAVLRAFAGLPPAPSGGNGQPTP
jgi:acetoin utilization deacetylase AcuC-like enzyme